MMQGVHQKSLGNLGEDLGTWAHIILTLVTIRVVRIYYVYIGSSLTLRGEFSVYFRIENDHHLIIKSRELNKTSKKIRRKRKNSLIY
jgi:hypothetical protein